jgi:L-fuculose-phosphate aldolase
VKPGDRVQVLFWMNRPGEADRRILQCHPMGDSSKPKRGVFALRSPMRPDPIGSTVVEVRRVGERGLAVAGLDLLDGSPVLDVKAAG